MDLSGKSKITVELDAIDTSILIDAIMFYGDHLTENAFSVENVLKAVVLRHIGKNIINQFVSKEEQDKIVKEHEETLLQALKKERESKS